MFNLELAVTQSSEKCELARIPVSQHLPIKRLNPNIRIDQFKLPSRDSDRR